MPSKVDNWIDDNVIADHKKKPIHGNIVVQQISKQLRKKKHLNTTLTRNA